MARPTFFPTRDSLVLDSFGNPCASVPAKVWSRQTGGTQVTDLVAVAADGSLGAAIPSGVLISDENGALPAFAGPDGGSRTVWVDTGPSGSRLALTSDPTGSGGGSLSGTGGGTVTTTAGVAADAALTGTYVPKWRPTTAYSAGAIVLNPAGQLVSAITGFTSAGSYSAANWTFIGIDGGTA